MGDLSIAHYYVPRTVKTVISSKQKTGVGTVRRVYDKKGRWMEETVMRWEEGKGFLISVHRGDKKRLPPPIEALWFRYALEPSERANRCCVRLVFYYRLRGGMWLLTKPFLHLLFRANLRNILRRLKVYYEINYSA